MPNFDFEGTGSVQMGKPLELDCMVADSSVPACWYKDGVKLLPQQGWDIQSNDTLRRLIIPTAELLHAGLYSCESSDDTTHFTTDTKGDLNFNLLIHRTFLENNLQSTCTRCICICLSVVFCVVVTITLKKKYFFENVFNKQSREYILCLKFCMII